MLAAVLLSSCSKESSGSSGSSSYSVCPVQVIWNLDYSKNLEYKLTGYPSNYSNCTVCFRRLNSSGYPKSYSEITDSRDNPNTYQTYRTYKKLSYDEPGVKVYWVELTDKNSGKVKKYVNYR